MTKLNRLTHMLSAVLFGLLAFCCLAPMTAAAQSLPPPLPLPHVTVYGTVTQNGEVLASGTVKAILPNGVAVTAPIGPINGTVYNYALVIPLFMTTTQTLSTTTGGVLTGDAVALFVDNQPAFYQDPATQLTMGELRILGAGAARTAAGRTYALDLALASAGSYPVGDVNANGVRNSADAMLALKYDTGLIIGVTAFPPGPNTVYLPLCDIVENGFCDSSDALLMLQCDVGMSGVICPPDRILGQAHSSTAATTGAPITLHTTAMAEPNADAVTVRVSLADQAARFGAATWELHYDPALFEPIGCATNPAGTLDLVICNPSFAPGIVRFNGIAASSADGATLVEARFNRRGAIAADLNAQFTLTADGVFDQAGADLAWNGDASAENPETTTFRLYMPTVSGMAGQAGPETAAPTALGQVVYLPAVSSQQNAAADMTAAPIADGAPTEAVSRTEVITRTEATTGTGPGSGDPVATPSPMPTPEGMPGPTPTDKPADSPPSPVATPVADLPKTDPDASAAPGQRLYLPLIDDE